MDTYVIRQDFLNVFFLFFHVFFGGMGLLYCLSTVENRDILSDVDKIDDNYKERKKTGQKTEFAA